MQLDPEHGLLIGIGNAGRQDDGIGWAMLDLLLASGYRGATAYRYQLNVEDAELISHYPKVWVIDASQRVLPEGFSMEKLIAGTGISYSTHSLEPAAILGLCEQLYDRKPEVLLLQIQGYDWGIGEGLSKKARENCSRAMHYLSINSNGLVIAATGTPED